MAKLINYQKQLNGFLDYIDELTAETALTSDDKTEIKSLNKLKLRTAYLLKRLTYLEIHNEDFSNKVVIKSMLKSYQPGELFLLNESRVFSKKLLSKLHQLMNKQVDKELIRAKEMKQEKRVEEQETVHVEPVESLIQPVDTVVEDKALSPNDFVQLTLF